MLIEKQQIRKVFTSNCKNQIVLFKSIQQKLSQTNNFQSITPKVAQTYVQIEDFMFRWMQLMKENQLLIQKYHKECHNAEINVRQYENMECALATQLYIKNSIEKQSNLKEIYNEQKFILWTAIQQLSQNLENIITDPQTQQSDKIISLIKQYQFFNIFRSINTYIFLLPILLIPPLSISIYIQHQQAKTMKKIKYINVEHSNQVLSNFAITLIIIELCLIILFGIFVRMNTTSNNDLLDAERYLALENINGMILIGFGYLMTAIKTNNLSALIYTLFVNALSIQFYILFQGLWSQVFSAFKKDFYIFIDQKILIKSSYCVVSGLIGLASVIGRINPIEVIKMSIVHVATYSLNEYLVNNVLLAYDAGSSMTVHVFGAYFGIATSMIIARYARPNSRPQKSYYSNVLAIIGTLFLWVYWPAFNFGVYASTPFQRTQIVTNTLLSLTGSTLATLVVTSIHGRGILVEDIQHASLVGGVAIGASAGILYLPPAAIVIGFLAGIISTNAFHYLTKKLQKAWRLFDFHGVHNTHGIPGIFGGLASSLIIAIYNTGYDTDVAALYSTGLLSPSTNFIGKAGVQVAAIATSLCIAIISGIIAGKFIGLFYEQRQEQFYQDCNYFDHGLFLNNEDKSIKFQEIQAIKKVPFNSQREQIRKTEIILKEDTKKTPPISQRVDKQPRSFRQRERSKERERERDRSRDDIPQIERKTSVRKSKREIKYT